MVAPSPAGTLGTLPQDNPIVQGAEGSSPLMPTATDMGRGGPPAPPTDSGSFASFGDNPRTASALQAMRATTMGTQLPPTQSPHVDAIGQGIQQTVAENPQAAAAPGGVMRSIVAGGLQALMKNVGDAAAATENVKAGQGALSGFAKAQAARTGRLQQEKQQQMQQQEFDEKKRMDDATIAHVQQQTIASQQMLRIAGNEAKQKQYDADQAVLGNVTAAGIQPKIANLDDTQINDYIKQHPQDHLLPVMDGLRQELDKNGDSFLRPTFSLFDKDGTVRVNADAAKEFDKYAPQKDGRSWQDHEMPFVSYMAMKGSMDMLRANDLAREEKIYQIAKNKGEAEKWEQEGAEKARKNEIGQDPLFTKTMAAAGGYASVVEDRMQDIIDAAAKDPNNQQLQEQAKQATKVSGMVRDFYGPSAINAERKELEQQRHNEEMERQKAAEEKLKAAKDDEKSVYAINNKTGETELTTKGAVARDPNTYSGVREVKQGDISKDTQKATQLNDAQMNVSRYRVASDKMKPLSLSDTRAMAAMLGDDKFKAHFFGAELPVDWFNEIEKAGNANGLSDDAKDALVGYIGSRGAIIAYLKAISGTGRANETQMKVELQNLPTPLQSQDLRNKFFDRFQQNLDQASEGIPQGLGVKRPREVREQIEKHESANKPASNAPDASQLPSAAVDKIKGAGGKGIRFNNGQVWKWQNGKAVFVGQQ